MIPHRAITLAARAPVASVSGAGGMGGLERSRTWMTGQKRAPDVNLGQKQRASLPKLHVVQFRLTIKKSGILGVVHFLNRSGAQNGARSRLFKGKTV